MNKEVDNSSSNTKETTRTEAFSDGVFAIAITLLILELIQILHQQNGEGLLNSFFKHWEPFAAFSVGFLTLLVCWINHHHVFDYIRKIDSIFLWINGFLLLVVTFTPFPTAILAEYLGKEGNTAMAIFGFHYFMMALSFDRVWSYVYNKRLIDNKDDRKYFYCIKLTYRFAVLHTIISFFICLISIPGAIAMYVIMFSVFAFPKEFASNLLKLRYVRNKLKNQY